MLHVPSYKLVVKYRDKLIRLGKVLEQEFTSSSMANRDNCNKTKDVIHNF